MNAPTQPSRLTESINRAKNEGRLARIPFVTAGIPDFDTFWHTLEELAANGADILEIGVPFSDPVADGPVVAKASEKALENGVSLHAILEGLGRCRNRFSSAGLVLMGYANPFLQYAWKRSADHLPGAPVGQITAHSLRLLGHDLSKAGVDGLIIPDLPLDELAPWREALEEHGIDIIALVGPNTSLERMHQYAQRARGFVYVTSVMGVTGVRQGIPPEAQEAIKRARQAFDIPVALGFGIKTPEQLTGMAPETTPDAVVFGSALITHLNAGKSPADFMRIWK